MEIFENFWWRGLEIFEDFGGETWTFLRILVEKLGNF